MRKILLSLLIFVSFYGFATHNRAGEILYKRIQPFTKVVAGLTVQVYTYSFTIIKYTDDGQSIADRCEDTLYFGDGERGVAPRVNGGIGCGCGDKIFCGSIILNEPGFRVKKNIYTIIHTYAGPGNYLVRSFDPNRNEDVFNIPGSVNLPFYIESRLIISNFIGANSSPQFKYDPIDRACVGQCFYHNPGAYDEDGDSLSYEITTSRAEDGSTVAGYFFPVTTPPGGYGINSTTGLLSWCTPTHIAQYNLAFIVHEWRKNTSGTYIQVGYVLRDMQVLIKACPNNQPPSIVAPQEICVEAGSVINDVIIVDDPNGGSVTLTGGGGAFAGTLPQAVLSNAFGPVPYSANFTWSTNCSHIRQQPYINIFKAEDNATPTKLVFFANYNIRVVPPSVKNVSATPVGSVMKISWSPSTCNPTNNPIASYQVYRKNDCTPVVFDPCKTGVDPSLGYTYIGQSSSTGTTLTDNNFGAGLVVGQDYSYLVVAVYTDGSQSFASTQVCAKLKRDVPILLNVDILSTSTNTGSVFVRWGRPLKTNGNLDTVALPGPYKFELKHRLGGVGSYTTVFTSTANFLYLLDTSFTHQNLNTVNSNQEYIVDFSAGTFTVGSSQKATSVFLIATAGDRNVSLTWAAATPWNNTQYTIYRKDPGGVSFFTIAVTANTNYVDNNNVVNRATYCYKVLSEGAYSDPSIFKPLLNNSQEVCATAKDISVPCTPSLDVTANCENGYVKVEWQNVKKSCSDDVIKYVLSIKETVTDDYKQIDTIRLVDTTVTKFTYSLDKLNYVSSCFAIQAIDSSGNASPRSSDYCVDNCPLFELPNIISVNGDGVNDFYKAIKVRQIKEIDLYIFDRWGNLVYKTKDPYFNWDGKSILSGQTVSDGTFFYLCDVFEPRVTGIKKRSLKGYLQVVR